ncbi:MAG: hypothetical protein IJO76_01080 [Clostridia bacterium]|nr:hypothetical protein [Clostridia bacterium]
MNSVLHNAVYAIPVPADLSHKVLAACRGQAAQAKPAPVIRYVPALATAAACAAVLGVTFASTGHLPFTGDAVSEAPTTTEKLWEEGYSQTQGKAPSAEIATEPAVSTTQNLTTTQALPTARPTSGKGSTVVGTTSNAKPPATDSTTQNNTTQSVTAATQGSDAACKLAIYGRFESMSAAELEAHYGRRYLPTRLPADMVQPEIYVERGVYYKDEAIIAKHPDNWAYMLKHGFLRDAEIVYDENSYEWYSMENADRRLMVHVSTAPYPQHLLGDVTRFDETVTVGGVEVRLHHYDDRPYSDTWCYSAVVQVDGIAFYLSAWEFTREEFLDTLASLLEA